MNKIISILVLLFYGAACTQESRDNGSKGNTAILDPFSAEKSMRELVSEDQVLTEWESEILNEYRFLIDACKAETANPTDEYVNFAWLPSLHDSALLIVKKNSVNVELRIYRAKRLVDSNWNVKESSRRFLALETWENILELVRSKKTWEKMSSDEAASRLSIYDGEIWIIDILLDGKKRTSITKNARYFDPSSGLVPNANLLILGEFLKKLEPDKFDGWERYKK